MEISDCPLIRNMGYSRFHYVDEGLTWAVDNGIAEELEYLLIHWERWAELPTSHKMAARYDKDFA